jgi:hypothetical protein
MGAGAVTTDLTARIAELASRITARLDGDEAAAKPYARTTWTEEPPGIGVVLVDGEPLIEGHTRGLTAHVARHDPARVLRRVTATRELVTVILGEPHDLIPGDEYYSCSQAAAGTGMRNPPPEDLVPGSGCSDDERRGQPCDCGRDARVARLLAIIATEWEGDGA